MKDLSDYIIKADDVLSKALKKRNIFHLGDLADWLKHLPYRRISDASDLQLTILENCGTCSSKHAFFKLICDNNGYSEFNLCIGIFKMSKSNTPNIGSALDLYDLDYIPEAHCYIRWNGEVIDVTLPHSIYDTVKDDMLTHEIVELKDLHVLKPEYHKSYITQWKKDQDIHMSMNDLWKIREACILNISKHS